MSKNNKQMQDIIKQFEQAHPGREYTTRELGSWAIREGLYRPRPEAVTDIAAREFGSVLRSSVRIDSRGRKVRTKHCVSEVVLVGDKMETVSFWHNLETAPPDFMLKSFAQRRDKAVNVIWQLKQDVDSYNENHNKAFPVQIEFNFEEDMVEKQFELDSDGEEDFA